MDEETFFKGVEVGRALRGWRTPDTGSNPAGTTTIKKNGEYDVSRYASAAVDVQFGEKALAENALQAVQGSEIELCTMSDTGLSVTVGFIGFEVDTDGYPKYSTLRVTVSVTNGSHNGTGDYLGYVMPPDTFAIPDNVHLGDVYWILRVLFQGSKDVDFLSGPTKNGHKLSFTSSQLPLGFPIWSSGGSLSYADSVYRISCSGDAWNSYSGSWTAFWDINFGLG